MDPATRLRLLEAAASLVAESKRIDVVTAAALAARGGVAESVAALAFPEPDDVALALYGDLAGALTAWSENMPDGTAAARFRAVIEKKLALLAPKRAVWLALVRTLVDDASRARLNAPEAGRVMRQVLGVFQRAVRGAVDAPSTAAAANRLARHLYAAHLGVLLAWSLAPPGDDGNALVADLVHLATQGAGLLRRAAPLLSRLDAVRHVDRALERVLFAPGAMGDDDVDGAGSAKSDGTARKILAVVLAHRRSLDDVDGGTKKRAAGKSDAIELHIGTVRALVDAHEPVQLVSPAFPAKAPNAAKVLGPLPDAAEKLAVAFLARLLDEIAAVYPPGAALVIASDGHVFADVVGVPDGAVNRYRAALASMLPAGISLFTLRDALPLCTSDAAARTELLARFSDSVDEIRARAKSSSTARAQLDGMHRFLFEDEIARLAHSAAAGNASNPPPPSRTQVRAATRERAVEVVRRSEAWGKLVASAFPRALRLSIHPQPPLSTKIGIHLLPTHDAWLTPWHGAAVFEKGAFTLMKRAEAEARGAVVVDDPGSGLPSHLEIRPRGVV